MSTILTPREASVAAPGWRLLAGQLHLSADFGDFDRAMEFVTAVAEVARTLDHHPDIDIRWSRVHLSVSTHAVGALTNRDVRLATQVSGLLADRGIQPDHARLSAVEIAIDTMDSDAIRPFWAAVLGRPLPKVELPDEEEPDVPDPDALGPRIRFEQLLAPCQVATGCAWTSGCPTTRPSGGSSTPGPRVAAW
nr:4a-hydroxytetrahydrobiopterin dehydratase [Raineyella fluvialis]